jgi:hypothetical protein
MRIPLLICMLFMVQPAAMAQIFAASADTWLRAAMAGTGLVVLGALLVAGGYVRSSYLTGVGWPVSQPVPFSHQHHVGGLGIDCRFCHAAVERGPHAGLPASAVCMTCHSQIWTGAPMLAPVRDSLAHNTPLVWNRVARLPDYVFFNHSIHVARGVPCVACHGRVDRMPLLARAEPFEMRWCLECHRDPGPRLRPPEEVTRMDWSGWVARHAAFGAQAVRHFGIEPDRLQACSLCHR